MDIKNKRSKILTCLIIVMLPLSVYVAYAFVNKEKSVQVSNVTAIEKYRDIQEKYEQLIKRQQKYDARQEFIVENLNFYVNEYFKIENPTESETKGRDNSLALLREIFEHVGK